MFDFFRYSLISFFLSKTVFQIDVESGEISQDEISVRFKKQLSTGPHKGRKQRLEDKARSKFVRT